MKTIGLIINQQRDRQFEYAKKTIALLEDNGFQVLLNQSASELDDVPMETSEAFFEECDAFVTLGGDGTILRIAPMAAKFCKPILGVNLGHLGYLAQLEKNDLVRLPEILRKETNFEHRFMLRLQIVHSDGSISCHHALNDITLSRQIVSNMLHAALYSNGEFVYQFRSDGLIFATPTGSTAYSMSSGGPIADCSLNDIIIVTPVCEHSFFSKSMIFSADDTLSCEVKSNQENTYIVADGKVLQTTENVSKILIDKSEYAVSLFQPNGKRFYRVLNSKFSDGGVNERLTPESNY